jgi:hypothetical protein
MGFWQVFSVLPNVYGASAPDELSGWLQWTNFVNLDWMSSGLRIECAGDLHRAFVIGWRSSLPYILMLVFTYLPNVTSLSEWPAVSSPLEPQVNT